MKFFKIGYNHLQTDNVDINKFEVCEVSKCIQSDAVNCGVFSLKVICTYITK